jgi:hypothetical protein
MKINENSRLFYLPIFLIYLTTLFYLNMNKSIILKIISLLLIVSSTILIWSFEIVGQKTEENGNLEVLSSSFLTFFCCCCFGQRYQNKSSCHYSE